MGAYYNVSSISSILGNVPFKSSGICSSSLYSLTPIGFVISLSEYSATNLFFSLHNIIPIDGLSISVFKVSSTAER